MKNIIQYFNSLYHDSNMYVTYQFFEIVKYLTLLNAIQI